MGSASLLVLESGWNVLLILPFRKRAVLSARFWIYRTRSRIAQQKPVKPDWKEGKEMENKKSAEQSTLGDELDKILGPDEFKSLGQDIALVIAEHKLIGKPEICEKVFRYMSLVVFGWNRV